jgi:hypothetical protein
VDILYYFLFLNQFERKAFTPWHTFVCAANRSFRAGAHSADTPRYSVMRRPPIFPAIPSFLPMISYLLTGPDFLPTTALDIKTSRAPELFPRSITSFTHIPEFLCDILQPGQNKMNLKYVSFYTTDSLKKHGSVRTLLPDAFICAILLFLNQL